MRWTQKNSQAVQLTSLMLEWDCLVWEAEGTSRAEKKYPKLMGMFENNM